MARQFRPTSRALRIFLGALLLAMAVQGFVITRAQTQTQSFTCAGGFTQEFVPVLPATLMNSLSTVPNPVIPLDAAGRRTIRGDLVDYVANLNAAIRLGKALFWDMQVGSDNRTACATCHFQAGQDGRTRNQVNPGANGSFDNASFEPNSDLWPGAFPFTSDAGDIDNITGSQGVRKSNYGGLSKTGTETTASVPDPVFTANGKNVRQVTGRNAPSVVNAVFNARNFFDGRAQREFNGVNPFGARDTSAKVWVVGPLGPAQIDIRISDASLASQAVGPVLNPVEMSAANRTWPEVGRKLMIVKPLALQKVDPTDSVLGPYAAATTGLTTTYQAMIQAAFKPKWWNTSKAVRIGSKSYTMMEANASLFFGLSVMLYEATLVSDQTPLDRFLAGRAACSAITDPVAGAECIRQSDESAASLFEDIASRLTAAAGRTITSANIRNGLALFELPPPPAPAPNGVGCILCHVGAETTSASLRNQAHGVEPGDVAFQNAGFEQRLERMFWQIPPVPPGTSSVTLDPMTWTVQANGEDVPVAVYDAGYYNIGVRRTSDDPGVNGLDPFGMEWSIVRMLQRTVPDPSYIKVPGAGLNCGATVVTNSTGFPLLSGSLRTTERTRVAGSFKVPGLRNVELTAPYFHNGGKSTLLQVLEFYDEAGDFANVERAPLLQALHLTQDQIRDLIAFLLALTDERVRVQSAPFDHPQLFVANGDSTPGTDNTIELPAAGAAGATPLQTFLNLNPFQ
jgi:cytochrome c peroxidase